MPKGWFQRLPATLSRRELKRLLERAGGVCVPGGRHQEKWRFRLKDGVRTVPISVYDDYHVSYYKRVFMHELGLSKPQLINLLNGEFVSIPEAAVSSEHGQAPPLGK